MEPQLVDNQAAKRKQLSEGMSHMRDYVVVAGEAPAYGVPAEFQPVRKPRTEASANPEKRTDPFQFGSRFLEEGDDIFAYNAWDHVETDDTYKEFVLEQFQKQRENPVNEADKKKYNDYPERFWNKFYTNNTSNFFKNRKWLHQEFPILSALTQIDSPPTLILETGAGAGNTAFPILALNKNPRMKIHACDFSKKAVEVIKSNPAYGSEENTGTIAASVWDVAAIPNPETGKLSLPEDVEPGSVDVVIMIFIFSALAPTQWEQALRNIWHVLKPGGVVLFRDYGNGDLAQVRFKKGRWMEENFYVRGDGTRVYFFEEEELKRLWSGDRETKEKHETTQTENAEEAGIADGVASLSIVPLKPLKFEVLNLGVDRRMLVNRQRRLKMYRCWLQAKFRKPFENGEAEKKQAMPQESAVGMMANEAASEAALKVENEPAEKPKPEFASETALEVKQDQVEEDTLEAT
ncbi:actin binding protein [Venturia nashicola]|uniref:Actin binding protein n=1 Tax=Venturia nashicola TaxID=86259 RepID=A0A4Z1PP68_9PEZI|nr:actin binding protein [Venturia nashicola]